MSGRRSSGSGRGPSAREAAVLQQAGAHYRAGRFQLAEDLAAPLVRAGRGPVEAWHLLGLVAMYREQVDRALECFQRCEGRRPRDPQFVYLQAKALGMTPRTDEALAQCERALAMDPSHAPTIVWKATLLERAGRHEEAGALLRPLADRGGGEAMHVLARVAYAQGDNERCIEICRREMERPGQTLRLRQHLGFLLGRTLDRLGRCDEAFEAFVRANTLQEEPFDLQACRERIDAIMRRFDRGAIERVPRSGAGGGSLVAISAMPRSGTTLVESILDAHPAAQGVGESTDLERVVVRLPLTLGRAEEPYPDVLDHLGEGTMRQLGAEFMEAVAARAPGAERIVNKHLLNWQHLGFLSRLAPGARAIWVHRDPRDNCLGVWMQHFNAQAHGYAVDLEHIAAVYAMHERAMRFWIERLGMEILEVPYEGLVEHPEPWTRRIVGFCGLDWDEACLRFYESGRATMTHSSEQVRRPIYKGAIGRWRRYEHRIGPLLEALRREGVGEDLYAEASRGRLPE